MSVRVAALYIPKHALNVHAPTQYLLKLPPSLYCRPPALTWYQRLIASSCSATSQEISNQGAHCTPYLLQLLYRQPSSNFSSSFASTFAKIAQLRRADAILTRPFCRSFLECLTLAFSHSLLILVNRCPLHLDEPRRHLPVRMHCVNSLKGLSELRRSKVLLDYSLERNQILRQ